jgi:hypothetical protein
MTTDAAKTHPKAAKRSHRDLDRVACTERTRSALVSLGTDVTSREFCDASPFVEYMCAPHTPLNFRWLEL